MTPLGLLALLGTVFCVALGAAVAFAYLLVGAAHALGLLEHDDEVRP